MMTTKATCAWVSNEKEIVNEEVGAIGRENKSEENIT
jgi:hypothetical protein